MPAPAALAANRYPYPKAEALLRTHLSSAEGERRYLEPRLQESLAAVEAARRDVAAVELELQAARETLESAEILYEGVAASCRAVDDRIVVVRARLHPVRRVPADVLGEIFRFVAEDTVIRTDAANYLAVQKAPFSLAATCRSWRAAALAQPRLWRSLRLDFNAVSISPCAIHGAGVDRGDESRQECRWCRFIMAHLERSGALPIRLQLVGTMGLAAPCSVDIWGLLGTVSPRLSLLAVGSTDGPGVGLEVLLRNHMPILEAFTIDCTPVAGIEPSKPLLIKPSFFDSAPLLRFGQMRDFRPKLRGIDFAALVTLNLVYVEPTPARAIRRILRGCPHVKKLSIDVAHLQHDQSNEVLYPSVTDLTFIVKNVDVEEAIESFVFPCAEQLHLSLAPGRVTRTTALRCAETLTTLVISNKFLSSVSSPILTGASRLRSVEFIRCKLAEGLFRDLAAPLPDGSIACPALRKIHIVECSTLLRFDPFTGDALLRLIQLRNGGAVHRLTDVSLSWEDDNVPLRAGFSTQLQTLLQ